MLPLPSSNQCHYTVAFSPCGRWLAAGGSAHAVDVWDLQAPQNAAQRLPWLEPIVCAKYLPDDRVVAIGTRLGLLVEQTTGREVANYDMVGLLNGRINRAAVSSDGPVVVIAGTRENLDTLGRWLPEPNTFRDWPQSQSWASGRTTDLALTADARAIVARFNSLSPSGTLEVRSAGDGHILDTFALPFWPHRVACSADGTFAATLANGNLSVWNLTTRQAVADRTNPKHGGWLSVAFDPHGRRIVTGGIDSTVAVWDAASDGPPLTTFQWGVGPVYAVTFDRDGLRAAAAGHAGAIVWDVDE